MRGFVHQKNGTSPTNEVRRNRLCFAVLVLIALAISPLLLAETPSQGLLGRWRSTHPSRSGLGSMLLFRPDGTFDFSYGAVVEMSYRLENNEIVFPPATTSGPEQRLKVQFTGREQLTLLGDPRETLTRKGSARDPNAPLLGEWEGKRDLGGNEGGVRYIFYSEGKCLLLISFATRTLKYSIDGQQLRMEQLDHALVPSTFQIKDGVLVLHGSDGNDERYSRY